MLVNDNEHESKRRRRRLFLIYAARITGFLLMLLVLVGVVWQVLLSGDDSADETNSASLSTEWPPRIGGGGDRQTDDPPPPPPAPPFGTYGHIVIGLDLSKSNPLVEDPLFAGAAGAQIGRLIRDQLPETRVSLRTLGEFSGANPARADYMIVAEGRRSRTRPAASDVAREVSTFISNTPQLVEQGRLEAQDFTNIVAFLELMVAETSVVDCRAQPTAFILVTDGFEDSQYARLRDPESALPDLPGRLFAECAKLLMLGVGQGQDDPREAARLRTEWERWARAEGFEDFTALTQW